MLLWTQVLYFVSPPLFFFAIQAHRDQEQMWDAIGQVHVDLQLLGHKKRCFLCWRWTSPVLIVYVTYVHWFCWQVHHTFFGGFVHITNFCFPSFITGMMLTQFDQHVVQIAKESTIVELGRGRCERRMKRDRRTQQKVLCGTFYSAPCLPTITVTPRNDPKWPAQGAVQRPGWGSLPQLSDQLPNRAIKFAVNAIP